MLNLPVSCGFVPEDVLYDLNASQALVYGTIHYLSFNKIAVTTPIIQKYLKGISRATIISVMRFLIDNFFIKKQKKEILFKTRHSRKSKNFVEAKELSATHVGAYLPMCIASNPDFKRIEKMIIAFMYGFNKIDKDLKFSMSFLNTYETFRCRGLMRVSLDKLVSLGLLLRYVNSFPKMYYYQVSGGIDRVLEKYEGEINA